MYIIARTVHTAISRSEPPIWAATWAAEAAAVNAPNRAIGAWDASAPAGMFVHRDRGMGGGRGRADPAHAGSQGTVPSESTFRRTLQRLDADAFDDLAGAWAQRAVRPGPKKRRVIAVDGKTLRGSGHGGRGGRHLPAALDHAHGVVFGQADVDVKTNEVRREAPCRIPIQLGGTRKEVLGSMANTQPDIVIFSPGPVCQRLPWLVCSDSLRVGPAGCARSDRWP